MKEAGANIHIITSLDDTGWLLNIRGMDVDFFPLLLSYTVVFEDHVDLYVDESKFSDEIKANLAKDNVVIKPYNQSMKILKDLIRRCCISRPCTSKLCYLQ